MIVLLRLEPMDENDILVLVSFKLEFVEPRLLWERASGSDKLCVVAVRPVRHCNETAAETAACRVARENVGVAREAASNRRGENIDGDGVKASKDCGQKTEEKRTRGRQGPA